MSSPRHPSNLYGLHLCGVASLPLSRAATWRDPGVDDMSVMAGPIRKTYTIREAVPGRGLRSDLEYDRGPGGRHGWVDEPRAEAAD
ncbi:hypothetical protein GGTG_01920 [Gaeumannomyces tritici R3-111a-1]|uniref:Uncharacterized protein n=1 Tax=Gaeumannomyces tritici (strain R3-111a-1) TaxID=644352 RepID=J3NKX9_GAET3|nr:hypothetical protein GGTG_01920 [Gaeumannomyces tritici R3-111a-1]EJT81946.1 hypothetical protein GGTG_01920 [Gaeumannomyces tritici R3-111a-1]